MKLEEAVECVMKACKLVMAGDREGGSSTLPFSPTPYFFPLSLPAGLPPTFFPPLMVMEEVRAAGRGSTWPATHLPPDDMTVYEVTSAPATSGLLPLFDMEGFELFVFPLIFLH